MHVLGWFGGLYCSVCIVSMLVALYRRCAFFILL
jgi:hypothetical protein